MTEFDKILQIIKLKQIWKFKLIFFKFPKDTFKFLVSLKIRIIRKNCYFSNTKKLFENFALELANYLRFFLYAWGFQIL